MNAYDIKSVFSPKTACDHCHEKKIRCDKVRPQCTNCRTKNNQCTYGIRYKRGPKGPREGHAKKKVKIEGADQLKQVKKSNARVQAMLFELEFNKKIAELWQTMLNKNTPRALVPKFNPETEEFIKSPQAVSYLMNEFDHTMRLIYVDAGNFATNLDFATKIWQALTQISFTELLPIFNGFSTPLLVTVLEYIIFIAIGLKLNYYHDFAEYTLRMAHSIINTIVYARADTNDTLTPELTPPFNICLAFIVTYYRSFLHNYYASKAMGQLIFELYEQNKHKGVFNKDYEARMCIRKVLHTESSVDQEKYLTRVRELGDEGVMNPSLYYYLYYHLSFIRLATAEDALSADTCIQKAEYYINWHIDQSPLELRDHVRDLFDCKLNTIHAEIAVRLGDAELARKKVGGLIQVYSRVSPPAKRLITHLLGYTSHTYKEHRMMWSFDYHSLLNVADVTMDRRAMPIGQTYNSSTPVEIESNEDDNSSANEVLLSFDELLAADPSLSFELDPSYDGFTDAGLENSPQYTIA